MGSRPLDSCERRIRRSSNYIKEAEALLSAFARDCEHSLAASYDAESGQYLPILKFPDAPEDLPLAISDAIHNLRAALDYLVYELALKDSGSVQYGTQFPLETCKLDTAPSGNPIGFDAVKGRFLRGISDTHTDAIELLQPYNGVKWTQTLKDISNPDKHRKLTTIRVDEVMHAWTRTHGRGKRLPTGQAIHIDPTDTVRIELPDRKLRIVLTLYEIQAAVMDTVNSFKSAF